MAIGCQYNNHYAYYDGIIVVYDDYRYALLKLQVGKQQ